VTVFVVDTCVLVDVAEDDPVFGARSAACLAAHLPRGLTISPVSYVELAPLFDGSTRLLDEFLAGVGVSADEVFDRTDRMVAFRAWGRHVSARRAGHAGRRPVTDALIGALAVRHEGLITRNGADFRSFYPSLPVLDPMGSTP
jgi:predicted nucleic acid-binding protein